MNLQTHKIKEKIEKLESMNNAGAHNSIYRGKDITSKFYDGTLSQQIANQTFEDVFIGDYIIGKTSGKKYLVADINYRLHCGDVECNTPHILMISENCLGTAKMNDTNTTTGAYVGSKMYTTNLTPFKNIIKSDFGQSHILSHKNFFANATTNGYESGTNWINSDIDLMNEIMVSGSNILHNAVRGSNISAGSTVVDKSQLAIFRLDKSKIISVNNNSREGYWLRDVVSTTDFACVGGYGVTSSAQSTTVYGVRPAFLVY